jgi:hypothetical protein
MLIVGYSEVRGGAERVWLCISVTWRETGVAGSVYTLIV